MPYLLCSSVVKYSTLRHHISCANSPRSVKPENRDAGCPSCLSSRQFSSSVERRAASDDSDVARTDGRTDSPTDVIPSRFFAEIIKHRRTTHRGCNSISINDCHDDNINLLRTQTPYLCHRQSLTTCRQTTHVPANRYNLRDKAS